MKKSREKKQARIDFFRETRQKLDRYPCPNCGALISNIMEHSDWYQGCTHDVTWKCSKPKPHDEFSINQEMAETLVGKPVTAGIDGPQVGTVLSTELQESARRVVAHVQVGEVHMNAVVLQGARVNEKEPNA